MKKKIYIAYTGGTIGMKKTPDGYAPEPGFLEHVMDTFPSFHASNMPEYTVHEYNPLLDSSNMTPSDWVRIARDIAAHHDRYDGFVVIHGTDTMAYSASALAFMLEGLRKPVILTGSQIPFSEWRNDAHENLITSLLIAADYAIPEVCVFFGGKLLRGCRSVKVDATSFLAYDSPRFPPLGEAGINIRIEWGLVRPMPHSGVGLNVREIGLPLVGALRLFPGISAQIVRNVLQPPMKGLVLETYGVGNAPDSDRDFLNALEEATQRGVVIVDCTQCLRGSVVLGQYAVSSALARAGVISGNDMTTEAALAKLFFLFSADYSPQEVKAKMQENLRGELTLTGEKA